MKDLLEKIGFARALSFILAHASTVPDKSLIKPRRDWKIVVLGFLLVSGAGALFALQTYTEVEEGTLGAPVFLSPKGGETLDREKLESVVKILEERRDALVQVVREKTSLPDPSK